MDFQNNKHLENFNNYKSKDYLNFHKLYNVWNKSLLHETTKQETVTEEMVIGSIIHLFILENVSLDELVLVLPKLDKRKKNDKELYDYYVSKASEECKYIIDEDTHTNILNMYESLYDKLHTYSEYEELLECFLYGQKEKEIIFDYPYNDKLIKCKSMLDIYHNDIIVDLKTTVSSNPNYFTNDIKKYGYDYQLMFYSLGVSLLENENIKNYNRYILSIEKFYPYDITVYNIPFSNRYLYDIHRMFEKYLYQLNNQLYSGYTKQIINYEGRYKTEISEI